MSVARRVEEALGVAVRSTRSLAGGCIGSVLGLDLDGSTSGLDGKTRVVAKVSEGVDLRVEAAMLRHLADHALVPVPGVLHDEATLLVMEWCVGNTGVRRAEEDAARVVAALHDVTADHFGFPFETLIGGLPQVNPQVDSWTEFYGQHRLVAMAVSAAEAGQLPRRDLRAVEEFAAARLVDRIPDRPPASLLHGDLWGGNILSEDGRITALLDPALYHGHGEVDLAFATMFGTVGERFFDAYRECRGLDPDFFQARRDVYLLYPTLVHVRLFGGSYVDDLRGLLRRVG